ncbi:hypothetical protein SUGI_0653570 [Cryptomeria japonica]|nr:hypothetical protein SUGI_0653570 [Cryptomeria japonica]
MALSKCFAALTMLLLIAFSVFQPTFSAACGSSATQKAEENMELLKVRHYKASADPAAILEETTSQEIGKYRAVRQRKVKPKFQCKRQIPGGPDPQHH